MVGQPQPAGPHFIVQIVSPGIDYGYGKNCSKWLFDKMGTEHIIIVIYCQFNLWK